MNEPSYEPYTRPLFPVQEKWAGHVERMGEMKYIQNFNRKT